MSQEEVIEVKVRACVQTGSLSAPPRWAGPGLCGILEVQRRRPGGDAEADWRGDAAGLSQVTPPGGRWRAGAPLCISQAWSVAVSAVGRFASSSKVVVSFSACVLNCSALSSSIVCFGNTCFTVIATVNGIAVPTVIE